ncbi:MAG: LLM class F420-dependent oxidoreductase [Acidimicrobiales bacterium]
MHFGLRYANLGPYTAGPAAIEIAQAAEAAGFESIWTIEHVVVPGAYQSVYPYAPSGKMTADNSMPIPDPLVWLTFVAGATKRIKLGTGILIVPQRNPVVLAKELASIDSLSGGRMLLGIGVGWLEEEFDAIGVPFTDRGPRTEEYVEAMRTLWRDGPASFHGSFVRFENVWCRPQPAGNVPVIVGGQTKVAARRAGRMGDGYFPARAQPWDLIDEMRRAAEAAGRDPDAVEITVSAPDDPRELAELERRGVHRVLVPVTGMVGLGTQVTDPDSVLRYGRDVISGFADTPADTPADTTAGAAAAGRG